MTLLKRHESRVPSFPSLFDNWMNRDLMDWMNWNFSDTNTTVPAVNVMENENEFVIEVAAPGMQKDDFKVNLDQDTLTISSERKSEHTLEKKGRYTKHEFSYQSFQRSFTLPERLVDAEKIVAKYDNGILHITLPKREEAKPRPAKVIEIK
ncbi:HSP20 family protein [Breznakibacter xylanolyticus]|uniref:HSP20 family protein n=1 Tax=Breznakibacter xylanolyticus TaxID=990 RepID=A0A2W7N7U7_9BACT|nr:Hsp20/alpha crystallin family protein [Breznakibacter xylanolyticus]MBN2744799.1 Hsp20/alpha crystallin family protein [Marinilabiliaceae bacterium]PZX12944.1 HSP20 family protein [Breznakibacter xylanolyticus]